MIDTVHICIAMKPTEGSFAQNAIEHGVAGLNVDATRVGSEKRENQQKDTAAWSGNAWGANPQHDSGEAKEVEGRWPANVLLDGSEDVQSRFPFTESHPGKVRYDNRNSMFGFGGGGCAGDAGSASRFFKECSHERRDEDEGTRHTDKPDKPDITDKSDEG